MVAWIWMNQLNLLCNWHLDQKLSRTGTCNYLELGSTAIIGWLSVWSATLPFPQKTYTIIYGHLDIMKGKTFRRIKGWPFVRATLHPDAPAALELSIALTEGSWTLASPHLILS